MKRLLAAMLMVALVIVGLPEQKVLVEGAWSEENTNEEKRKEITEQIDTVDTEKRPYFLEYVFVERTYISQAGIQKIVVGINGSDNTYDKAVLKYMDVQTEIIYEVESDLVDDGAVMFAIEHEKNEMASYQLIGIDIQNGKKEYTIDFLECGIKAGYGVNQETSQKPDDNILLEDELSLDVMTTDEEGNVLPQNTLNDILERQESRAVAYSEVQETSLRAENEGQLVVVLDPGHDKQHSGARKNGYSEEALVLKIAQYCKEELEKYAGVTVYMTREGEDCAFGFPQSGSITEDGEKYTYTALCNKRRVEFAEKKSADVFVSFHLNSNTSSTPNGAGVYYPNSNYRPDLGEEGKGLAQKILGNLRALGLAQWADGILIRNSENNTVYPDDSLADYLGVIRRCKLAGIPAVLIEHAFLSNVHDVENFLSSDEKLRKLGKADALAIAEYYGLSEERIYPDGTAIVSVSMDSEEKIVKVTADGVPYAHAVQFAVWSDEYGQDDLRWYDGIKNEKGVWEAQVPIENHKSTGIYYVHTYILRKNGGAYYGGATTFTVQGLIAGSVKTQNLDQKHGTFQAVISGITSASGIERLQVPIWTEDSQNDMKWYNAVKLEDGTYIVDVNIADHNYNYGNYKIHTYATTGNGIYAYAGGGGCYFAPLTLDWKIEKTSDERTCQIGLGNVSYGDNIQNVEFAVWSEQGGQDDLKWYTANLDQGNTWQVTVPISNHKSAGKYAVHAYATLKNGDSKMLGINSFEILQPIAKKVEVINVDAWQGTMEVLVSGITNMGSVSKIQIPIWRDSDQNDIAWYDATLNQNGTATVLVDIKNHQYHYGDYKIHVYATDYSGRTSYLIGTAFNLEQPNAKISSIINKAQTYVQVYADKLPYGKGIEKVSFAVWSQEEGQDDLVWYEAERNSQGGWSVNVPLIDHQSEGVYLVHAYATLKDGTVQYIGATTFWIEPIRIDRVTVDTSDENNGIFHITLEGVQPSEAISEMQVGIWSDAAQEDLKWYTATRNLSGNYQVNADIRNHNNHLGRYQIHVYAYAKNGIIKYVGSSTCTILNASTGNYTIMGTSAVNHSQLVRYYKANNPYPEFYEKSDAPTIEDFCRIYLEECAAEGVKAEVAFCQSMKETGFLRYDGDAKIEQYNFAGLDTTGRQEDGSVDRGRTYSSVQEGIRAHVQRLKAYAVKGTTPESFAHPCIDSDKYTPWWTSTIVGSAPCVEWLGKSQNPSGYGWATDPDYGYSIINDYITKLLTY